MAGRAFAHPETADAERELPTVSAPAPVRRKAAPLVVGSADDRAELEADRVADEVISRLQGGESGETHVHDGCHGVARTAAPVSGAPEVGYAGGEISDDLSSRIESKRGSGSALPDDVRRRMESGFGRSLGNVRVHTDGESARLNRSISARAFTTGNDIFFGAGEFNPSSAAGEKVLAHELAHTQQQTGSTRRLHRFSLAKPDFDQTNSVTVFGAGGSGNVAKFDDGSGAPLVVKVDQLIGNEVSVAGKLHSATAAENGGDGGFTVTTPGVRLATGLEKKQIKKQTLAKIDPTVNPRNFVTGLDSDKPTIIMEMGAGKDFSKVLSETQHTKKGRFGKTVANEDSILFQVVKQPGPLTTLGQQLPVDVVMGMFDRVIGYYNPDNFMYDAATQSFGYVDNTQNGPWGYITSVDLGDSNRSQIFTHHDGFQNWAASPHVANLIGAPAALAQSMFNTLIGQDENLGMRGDAQSDPTVGKLFEAAVKKNRNKMLGWIQAGIVKGRATVINQLQNPLPLVAGLPFDRRLEALQSLLAKNLVLKGVPPAKAWASAGVHANRLLPPSKKPPAVPPKPTAKASPGANGTTAKVGANT
jgi:hypothetical protein